MPLSQGALIAVASTIGAIIVVAALAVGYVFWHRRKKRTAGEEERVGRLDDGNASVQPQTLRPGERVLALGLVLPSALICKLAEAENENDRIFFTFTLMKGSVHVYINPQLSVTQSESYPRDHDVFEIALWDQFSTRKLDNVKTIIIHSNAPDDIWEELDLFRLFYVRGQDRTSLIAEIERIAQIVVAQQPPTPE